MFNQKSLYRKHTFWRISAGIHRLAATQYIISVPKSLLNISFWETEFVSFYSMKYYAAMQGVW